jgi:L-ascorbate metabolism protein UlaG (beta-lactamase superfamily)
MTGGRALSVTLALLGAALLAGRAQAEGTAERCLAVSESRHLIERADYHPLEATQARLSFIGHATWVIESPGGVRIATDYNDYVRAPLPLDVATMNRAHATHYSDHPDPGIAHVLRGWNPEGGPVRHDLTVGDVRIRNVQTNIRDWGGGAIAYGNSIFIFEVAGMCIGHLGHLHHTLSDQQIAQIGQLDAVMVPVDGSYTMDTAGMVEVLKSLRARLILPMHYFNPYTLDRFLARIRNEFAVEMADAATIVISQATLPSEPKVLVLPGS